MPKCEYRDGREAVYDFVDKSGNWRYGCMTHWIEHRVTRQLGPGMGRHLTPGVEPPPRPEGQEEPPPLDPVVLAQPRVSMTLREQMNFRSEPTSQAKVHLSSKKVAQRRAHHKEFHDMPPTGEDISEPKPGSRIHTAFMMTKDGGATLEEIQERIGAGHNALKLLEWMNENKGFGFKRDPETMKITLVWRA